MFLWQLSLNGFPFRGNLAIKGVALEPLCSLCKKDIETIGHLFLKCGHSLTRLWELAKNHHWFSLPSNLPMNATGKEMINLINSHLTYTQVHKFIFLLWSTWKERNGTTSKNEIVNPLCIIIKAKRSSAEWRARCRLNDASMHPTTNNQVGRYDLHVK